MKYIHASFFTFPETELKSIDWCSEADMEQDNQVVTVRFGNQEVYLHPELTDELDQIYSLFDLTKYTGMVCNLTHINFVRKFPDFRNIFDDAIVEQPSKKRSRLIDNAVID